MKKSEILREAKKELRLHVCNAIDRTAKTPEDSLSAEELKQWIGISLVLPDAYLSTVTQWLRKMHPDFHFLVQKGIS